MTDTNSKLETVIGVALLLAAVLGFLLMIVLQLPKDEAVQAQARPLPILPRDFFSAENEVTEQVKKLTVPSGVPVTVDQGKLGRSNVFEGF